MWHWRLTTKVCIFVIVLDALENIVKAVFVVYLLVAKTRIPVITAILLILLI